MAEADEASEHDLVGKRSATMPQGSTQVSLFVFLLWPAWLSLQWAP